MRPVFQSRVGKRGRCFNAALASILEIPEASVPDFDRPVGTDYWKNVAAFLAKHGLSYQRVPLDTPPVGWGTIEGVSPRGGNHACVSFNGKLVHDPHKPDGTGNGLVEPKYYGMLTPLRGSAKDAVPLSGKRLNAAAEPLRTKHDEIKSSMSRTGRPETAYHALHQPTLSLLREASSLFERASLDDDPAYWAQKLTSAKQYLAKSEGYAKQRAWGQAAAYQDAALSMLHTLIDKMRRSGPPGKANDDLKLIPNSKDGSQTLTYPKQVRTYRTWAERRNRAGAKDMLLDRYSMSQILDVLGIDIKEYTRRTEQQKTQLLKTALERLTIPKRTS